MNEAKQQILNRINDLIDKREFELLERFPDIHEIDDGIVIRFFSNWDNCGLNEKFRYKKITTKYDISEINILHYIPKGTVIDLEKRDYIKTILCVSGKIELKVNNEVQIVNSFEKIKVDFDDFEGITLEDSYIITSNKA